MSHQVQFALGLWLCCHGSIRYCFVMMVKVQIQSHRLTLFLPLCTSSILSLLLPGTLPLHPSLNLFSLHLSLSPKSPVLQTVNCCLSSRRYWGQLRNPEPECPRFLPLALSLWLLPRNFFLLRASRSRSHIHVGSAPGRTASWRPGMKWQPS